MLDALPSDWTDLELDLRIDDESALHRHRGRPQPGQRAALLRVGLGLAPAGRAQDFGHAAAAETVLGVLAKLDEAGVAGELAVARGPRGPLRGRPDVGTAGERARGVPPAPRDLVAARDGEGRRVAADLMLGSRVEAMLSAAGHDVTLSWSLAEAHAEEADLVVADLDTEDAEALVATGVPVLGYYSHVDVETRRAAEAAGVAGVVPRSRMVRELPELAASVLSRGSLNAASTSSGRSSRPCSRSQAAHSSSTAGVERGGLEVGPQEPQLGRLVAAVEGRDRCEQVVERLGGVFEREPVAAGGRFDHRVDEVRVLVDRPAGRRSGSAPGRAERRSG